MRGSGRRGRLLSVAFEGAAGRLDQAAGRNPLYQAGLGATDTSPTLSTRQAWSRSHPRWRRCDRSNLRSRSTNATEPERWREQSSRSKRWSGRSAPRRRATEPRRKSEPADTRRALTRGTRTCLAKTPTATPGTTPEAPESLGATARSERQLATARGGDDRGVVDQGAAAQA